MGAAALVEEGGDSLALTGMEEPKPVDRERTALTELRAKPPSEGGAPRGGGAAPAGGGTPGGGSGGKPLI